MPDIESHSRTIYACISATELVAEAARTYGEAMSVLPQRAHGAATGPMIARELVFPALALAAIVASVNVRIPLGLPGHRGLVWLSLLVAVVLGTRARTTVLVVGAGASAAALTFHPAPWDDARYLAAAILLYAVAAPGGRRRLRVALAAAPIHLVGLAGSAAALIGGRYWSGFASVGMSEKVLWHLGFGLAAGLLGSALGCAVAYGADRPGRNSG